MLLTPASMRWTLLLLVLGALGSADGGAMQGYIDALSYPARIVVAPTASIVESDTKISFFCRADGNPIPAVGWKRNGERISALSRYVVLAQKNGLSTLRIEPVRSADNNSQISCTADNGVGTPVESKALLTVLNTEDLPPERFPEIQEHPKLKAVEKNRPAQVLCTVKSPNSTRVMWLRDLLPLDMKDSRYTVATLGNPGSLMIQNSQEKDEGKYECVARNQKYVAHSKAAHLYVKVRRVPPHFSIPPKPLYKVGPGGSVNLTCVAVGYPMPKVFWRRGFHHLMEDPETAPVGRNVLMLKGVDSSENYTCVAISKLGNIEFLTTVQVRDFPPAPANLRLSNVSAYSVSLVWDGVPSSNDDPLKHYIVQYRPKNESQPSASYTDGNDYLESAPTKTTKANIEGLEPWQEYEFRVLAENTVGRGPPSIPKEVQTSEAAPDSPPLNVQARALSLNSILVRWQPPERPNGKIEAYIVHYTSSRTNPFTQWKKEEFPDVTVATLSGLDRDSTYYIKVQARNSKGDGVLSETATVLTKTGIPGQVTSVTAEVIGPRKILLTWQPPISTPTIVGYTIQYNSSKNGKELQLESPVQSFTLDQLTPDTLYSMRVAARSARGLGAYSRDVQSRTKSAVPTGAPTIMELEKLGRRSLRVRWAPPSKDAQHGQLKSYRIRWQAVYADDEYSEDYPVEDTDGEGIQSADKPLVYDIENLAKWTEYQVTVSAGTLKGFGPESEPMLMRTGEDATDSDSRGVPSAPRNLEVTPLDATSVRVSWERPKQTNGELVGYYVYKDELVNGEPISDSLQKAMVISSPDQTYAVIENLKPNTEYSFRVNAYNRQGDGEFSRAEKLITTGLPPSAPRNLRFIPDHQAIPPAAVVHWEEPEVTYGLPINFYVLRYKPVDHDSYSMKQTTQTTVNVTGLMYGKDYEFVIQAVNNDGRSPNTTEKLSTPVGTPEAGPRNLRYDYQSLVPRSLIVSWEPPPADLCNGPIVTYRTVLKGTNSQPMEQVIEQRSTTSYQLSGNADLTYKFRVRACTVKGCGPDSEELTIELDGQVLVPPPDGVQVQATSNSSVVVTWRPVAEADGYVVHYIHEPSTKDDKNKWRTESVNDRTKTSLEISSLLHNSPYAFCVSSLRGGRNGECSEPPQTLDRLIPRHMVDNLHVVKIGAERAELAWEYTGDSLVKFYVNYTGHKNYLDMNLHSRPMNFTGVEAVLDSSARKHEFKNLRPFTEFYFRVGVQSSDGRRYWPREVKVSTLNAASPFASDPKLIGPVSEHAVELRIGPASEEYGRIAEYWLVIIPQAGKMPKDITTNELRLNTRNTSAPYVTGSFNSAEMTSFFKQQKGRFRVGRGVMQGEYMNHELNVEKKYRAFIRAFTEKNKPPAPDKAQFYKEVNHRVRPEADSMPSKVFSPKKAATSTRARAGNVWLIGPIIAILIITVIVGMLIIYWMKRNKKKQLPTRRGSISKVALGPTETSKLLMSDGYSSMMPPSNNAIMNPYDPIMTGITMNGTGAMVEPMELQQLNAPYAPLTQTPGMVAHPPIPITELASHIERLKANDNMLFFQEYESIETGQQFTWEHSNHEVNKPKNRYANVVAYDHSRVKLSAVDAIDGQDYINANYIDGYRKPKAYVATQGPLPETFGDFWRMVWEENSATIVMLTKLEERTRIKCDMYWPSRGSHTYGGIQVTLSDTLDLAHYTIRTLRLQKRGDTEMRDIRHLQFTAWPDHGVPDHPTPFLMFLKRVKSLNPPEAGPIITHCSAGIGRTGAFIAIDCMLDRLRFENTVDVYGCVTCLRSQRSYMVQTEDQYVFIHDSVLDAVQSGSTEVPAGKLYTHIQALMQIQPLDNASGMELEFRHLAALKMPHARFQTANQPCNKQKNRLVNILPYDSSRVALQCLPSVPDGSDYINASWIDGYRRSRSYVSTQGPLPATVEDFWRMLWEHNSCIIVMLTKLREMGREKCFQYWPGDRSERMGAFVVEPIAEYNMPQYVLREFKMTDTQSGQSRTVRHFQYTEWPEQGSPKSGELFVEFIGQVHKTKEQFGADGPITVHCSAGVGRTGVFVTLSIVLERMRYENVVDIFTTVKLLRTQRPNMVQSEDQYHFCYQAALEYLGSFDHYAIQCE